MRYAIIENNVVINIVEAESDFAQTQGWILMPDEAYRWDKYENGVFSRQPRNLEAEWIHFKVIRDAMLKESDSRVLADRWAAMTPEQQSAWTVYRQALRDLPTTYPDPRDIVFPTAP